MRQRPGWGRIALNAASAVLAVWLAASAQDKGTTILFAVGAGLFLANVVIDLQDRLRG